VRGGIWLILRLRRKKRTAWSEILFGGSILACIFSFNDLGMVTDQAQKRLIESWGQQT
jgi:uncharacterized membrane protein